MNRADAVGTSIKLIPTPFQSITVCLQKNKLGHLYYTDNDTSEAN